MSDTKKTNLLAAFTAVAKPAALAAEAPPRPPRSRPAALRRPQQAPDAPQSSPTPQAASPDQRLTLTYRTSRPNWERIKHLAISDRISVQDLFQLALSREFERRGLPALED